MTHRGNSPRNAKAPGTGGAANHGHTRWGDIPYIVDTTVPLQDRLRYQAQRFRQRKQMEIANLLDEAANVVVTSSHEDHRNDAGYR